MKKMLFILNPKAGMKKANRVLSDILNIFNRADFAVQVHITAGTQDATHAVKVFGRDQDLIVCQLHSFSAETQRGQQLFGRLLRPGTVSRRPPVA